MVFRTLSVSLAGWLLREVTSQTSDEECHTAVKGEECYGAVIWAKGVGVYENPEWYPNLTSESRFEDFQAKLHSLGIHSCLQPCPPSAVECHTAVDGEECYGNVIWAKGVGIYENPEWYPNLTAESRFEDFQAKLHSLGIHSCPQPCPPSAVECHTAVEGEQCYGAVMWAKGVGIYENPEWYPNLTAESPFEDFQARLHSCPQPCPPSPPSAKECHTAVHGEKCYGAVMWAKGVGIYGNPEWYPNLTAESPFEDFQARLYSLGMDSCQEPCRQTFPDCRLAVEGETCFEEVQWARQQGIWEHPEWYPDLTPDSPFEDFQAHFHSINHGFCPLPCGWPESTTAPPVPECSLMVTYCLKANCGFMQRCCIAGRQLKTGRCLQPTDWKPGHNVKVTLQEGSTSCEDSGTAYIEYFTNDTECSGEPHATMSIPTNGTKVSECRDIYGNLWPDYDCQSQLL